MEMSKSNYLGDSSSERPASGEEVGVGIVNAAEDGAGERTGVNGALSSEAIFGGTVAGSGSQQTSNVGRATRLTCQLQE